VTVTSTALIGMLALTLLLTGQTVLLAQLIVGAVLVVVFGTPLLCLLGLTAFTVWALTRAGRRRARPASAPAPDTRRVP
jgi:hypothetical protein